MKTQWITQAHGTYKGKKLDKYFILRCLNKMAAEIEGDICSNEINEIRCGMKVSDLPEAALLFWIGRTKHVSVYEKMAYPLMLLALFSMIHDWSSAYYQLNSDISMIPVINVNFLSSALFIAAFAFINRLNVKTNYALAFQKGSFPQQFFSILVPGILLVAVYFTFSVEISSYFEQLYINSKLIITGYL